MYAPVTQRNPIFLMRLSQSITVGTEKPNTDLGKVPRISSIDSSSPENMFTSSLSGVAANVHTHHTAKSDLLDATESIDNSQYRETKH